MPPTSMSLGSVEALNTGVRFNCQLGQLLVEYIWGWGPERKGERGIRHWAILFLLSSFVKMLQFWQQTPYPNTIPNLL